jgi:hypothetical protein
VAFRLGFNSPLPLSGKSFGSTSSTAMLKWIISVVWLALWGMGSALFFHYAGEQGREAEHLAAAPAGELHAEAVVEPGPTVDSPISHRACVATVINVSYLYSYKETHTDRTLSGSALVTAQVLGNPLVNLRVGADRLTLPLSPDAAKGWAWQGVSSTLTGLPPELHVDPAALDEARKTSNGYRAFQTSLGATEWAFTEGSKFFVAGRIVDGRLEPDPVLGHVEIFAGTKDELMKELRGTSFGLRIAGYVFVALSLLPLVVVGLFFRKKKAVA